MYKVLYIIFLSLFFITQTNAVEKIDKAKNILKTLSRTSLDKKQTLEFITKNVITFDDQRGDGLVTYYFYDKTYKRFKDLEVISEDFWLLPKMGYFKLLDNDIKLIWKIQLGKQNTINIKTKINSIGKLHEFSFNNKTNYYIKLEEKKINAAN